MTDEEIQCLILKVAYNDSKGVVHLARIVEDYGVPGERVVYNARCLKDKRFVRQKVVGGSTPGPLLGDFQITQEGRREYKSRCEQQ